MALHHQKIRLVYEIARYNSDEEILLLEYKEEKDTYISNVLLLECVYLR